MLDIRDVSVRFGGIVALSDLSFGIEKGQICGLIGPNGAGKTTLFNVVSRIYDPTGGTVLFEGADLLEMQAYEISRVGVFRTFQNLALWPRMTVIENVMVGVHTLSKQSFFTAMFDLGRRKEERRLKEEAYAILSDLGHPQAAALRGKLAPLGTAVVAPGIRAHRLRRGLSQEDLAERTGLSVRTIRYLESGKVIRPRPETARLLADAFGLQGEERERFHGELAAQSGLP